VGTDDTKQITGVEDYFITKSEESNCTENVKNWDDELAEEVKDADADDNISNEKEFPKEAYVTINNVNTVQK